MKALQIFSDEYLEHCGKMKPGEILEFLESFRQLHGTAQQNRDGKDKTVLISLKVPASLLKSFKTMADLNGLKYQTQIKVLMKKWLVTSD